MPDPTRPPTQGFHLEQGGAPGTGDPPDYSRQESRAHQLDRNWAELIQELRVIGTGVQILFAFLLTISFQARFAQANRFQRDLYLGTLLASGLAAALFIAPVALHRFLFQFRVKDEIVALTNRLAIAGLAAVAVSMVGAVLLVSDWVGGATFGAAAAVSATVVLGGAWFAGPLLLRRRTKLSEEAVREASDQAAEPAVPRSVPAEGSGRSDGMFAEVEAGGCGGPEAGGRVPSAPDSVGRARVEPGGPGAA